MFIWAFFVKRISKNRQSLKKAIDPHRPGSSGDPAPNQAAASSSQLALPPPEPLTAPAPKASARQSKTSPEDAPQQPQPKKKPRGSGKGKKEPANVDPTVGGVHNKNPADTIKYITSLANLSPAEQALAMQPVLNTKVARKKPGKGKKKNNGLEPILEYNDLGNDGYYIKPNLPEGDNMGEKKK